MWTLRAEYGRPMRGQSFAWFGGYEGESYSLTAQHHSFVSDRIALGAGVTATRFHVTGGHRWGGEVSGCFRWFFAELNELEEMGFFFDFTGGALVTDLPFPPVGTALNFTFTFGPGLEIPITDTVSLLGAIQFHHLSNALGRESPQNPSQNEARVWIGAGIIW